jgi:uroporphyrin-III C-methyltransferase
MIMDIIARHRAVISSALSFRRRVAMTDDPVRVTAPGRAELQPGHVWLTGAGPGDPGLLTLHALSGLEQADVVVYDALVAPEILALRRPDARLVFAGKRGGKPSVNQADIVVQLVALARQGLRVLRLKGGDPSMFGRAGEEVLALAEHGIPFRVIPGITAGLAALTEALIPATLRGVNQALVLATGHAEGGDGTPSVDWAVLAQLGQPIVLYMAMARIEATVQALLEGGLAPETPAAVIAAATTPHQRVLVSTVSRLPADVAREQIEAPAIVVVGEIVAMRTRLLTLLPELAEAAPWRRGS